jgi:anti-sigma-K factor RskA
MPDSKGGMTCEELLETAAAYALGVLEPAESDACARHLREPGPHRGCAEAVQEATAVAAKLAGALQGQDPPPQLWRALEARLGEVPGDPRARRRVWRELAGWFVAAAVIGFYIYNVPFETRRGAAATGSAPAMVRDAMGLMASPGTRLVAFVPRRPEAGRAALILNRSDRRAVVLCDRAPPAAARRLRLWSVRGEAPAVPIAPLALAPDGVASAQIGDPLFEAIPPDRLLISADDLTALIPTDVLLAAELR